VLIFGIEKSTPGKIRSPADLYRVKDSVALKSTKRPEERKIPTSWPTIENVQLDFANGLDVPLQDDDFVISNVGYVLKFTKN